MALFGRRRGTSAPAAPRETSRFTAEATALGWEPLDATACKGDLDTVVHESSRELYGLPPVEVHAVFPGGPRPSAKVRALVDYLAAELKPSR